MTGRVCCASAEASRARTASISGPVTRSGAEPAASMISDASPRSEPKAGCRVMAGVPSPKDALSPDDDGGDRRAAAAAGEHGAAAAAEPPSEMVWPELTAMSDTRVPPDNVPGRVADRRDAARTHSGAGTTNRVAASGR
jgi:hypothetical protein